MSLDPAIFRALVEQGASPEMLLAVVDAAAAVDEARKEKKRANNAERQARHRAKNNANNALPRVTERDTPSLDKETSPRPPKEIKPIPRENRERVRAPKFSLPSDIPEVEWDGFEEMRKRIGKPMTDRARTLAISELRKLADAGFPPGDVLNHCTMNSYQGIFPPKDGRNGRQQSNRPGPLGPSLSAAERFASFGDIPAH